LKRSRKFRRKLERIRFFAVNGCVISILLFGALKILDYYNPFMNFMGYTWMPAAGFAICAILTAIAAGRLRRLK
jgi:purine-cytosine permease-like protein